MSDIEALKLLGLNSGYTEEELRKAYHEKARLNHPDFNGSNSNEAMQKINRAYEVLRKKIFNISLSEYKNAQINRILTSYFEGIDIVKREISLPSDCVSFYNDNALFHLTFLSTTIFEFNLLKINVEKAKTKDEVDAQVKNFLDKIKKSCDDFATDCSKIVSNVGEKMLEEINFQNFTSIRSFLLDIYSHFIKMKESDSKHNLFITDKESKISEYNKFVDSNIPKNTIEYKEAASYYKKMFVAKDPNTFYSVYEEAISFVNNCVVSIKKREFSSDVKRVREGALDRFYSSSKIASSDIIRKNMHVLSVVLGILDNVLELSLDKLKLIGKISFSDYDSDMDILNEIRKFKEGVYIKKTFNEEMLEVYYAEFSDDNINLHVVNLLNGDEISVSSVSDDRFQTDYISLDEFFDKGLITNYEIEGGYSLFEYNDIVLCLKRFIGNENYLSFIKEDKVKRVSGGKRIDLDKEKIKQAIIKKVLVACNIQNKKVGRK